MDTVFVVNDVDDGWADERCTPMLRFVRKDGKLILQQMWQVFTRTHSTQEWRDVPVEESVVGSV